MRILLPVVATIALAGLCGGAGAEAQCPELTRLRNEAVETGKPAMRSLMLGSCAAYIRASRAWDAVIDYAADHQDVCDISDRMLDALKANRSNAVIARNNVCSGRPLRPFPADIVLQ